MSDDEILVTGATGNTGREVLRALAERGIAARGAVRDPDDAGRHQVGSEVEWVRFDFMESSTWESALDGCSGVFLLRPPPISKVETTLNPFAELALGRDLRVAFLSVAGAESNPVVPHHGVEKSLQRTDGFWTILRPGFFAQNLQDAYRRDIIEDDRLYVPAGSGEVTFVDLRDVAEVAVEALTGSDVHARRGYTLTGPEALTFHQVAELLTEVLDRDIRYEPASLFGYARHLRQRELRWAQVAVQSVLHLGLRFGNAEDVDPTLERLLGRSPHTMRQYVERSREVWAKQPSK